MHAHAWAQAHTARTHRQAQTANTHAQTQRPDAQTHTRRPAADSRTRTATGMHKVHRNSHACRHAHIACAPAATHAHMDTREQRQGPRRHGRKPSNSWSQTITTGTGVCLPCSATKPPKVVGSSEVCPGRGPRPGRGRGGRQGMWQKMTSVHQNPSRGGLFVSHQK